ncbi:MAG: aquaporin family protein [Thermoleophilia bacterium]|nr:aquaporin family protein [Thermoleophilia bacterium]
MKRAIAELVGTFVLVFLGTGSVVTSVVFFGGVESAALLLIGLSFGFAVLIMVYAFGHISGTHINPAVSIALWATGRFPSKDLLVYVPAQLIGAVLASITIIAIVGTRAVDAGMGGTLPGDGVNYGQAILVEGVTTFLLALTVWGSAVDRRAPAGFAGLAIGIVVAADIIVTGPIAGASMNTARTFGPLVAESLWGGPTGGATEWGKFPIYIIGPIVGAVIAGFLYEYIASLKSGGDES